MRTFTASAVAIGTALLIGLSATSQGLAKAHDNGVTNPRNGGMNTATGGRGSQADNAPSVGKGGLGDAVNGGKRGSAASAKGSDNSRAGGVGGQK